MAIVNVGEKPGHFCNHIIVVVVHVQINPLVFVRIDVHNFIFVFFGHNVYLIFSEIRLKLFCFLNTAPSKMNACICVEFLNHSGLHNPPIINNAMVLWIVMDFGFCDHKSASHTQVVIVSDVDDGFLFLQMFL